MIRIFLSLYFIAIAQAHGVEVTLPAADPEPIKWCAGDKNCLLKSQKIIPLFAKDRGMTEVELREHLNNCEGLPVSNLGFCGWYSRFGAEVELNDQVQRLLSRSSSHCKAKILEGQKQWEKRTEKQCDIEAEKETNGQWGHYGHEIKSICKERVTHKRRAKLESIDRCSPCKLCL